MNFHVGQQHTSLSDLWFSRGFEMCFPLLEGPVTYSSVRQHCAGSGMRSGGFRFEQSVSKTAAAAVCQELLQAF